MNYILAREENGEDIEEIIYGKVEIEDENGKH